MADPRSRKLTSSDPIVRANTYPHRVLPMSSLEEFRIFKLLPGEQEDPLVCELKNYSGQSFEAISWTWNWREKDLGERIQVGSSSVRSWPNLEFMLKALRSPIEPRYLWLDYLCINMKDSNERSEQILKVRKIFQMAHSACVWLGEEADDSRLAFQLIIRLMAMRGDDEAVRTTSPREWAALAALMNRKYFCRRWIIQELASARRILLHCGGDVVQWSDFADSILLLQNQMEAVLGSIPASNSSQQHQTLNLYEATKLWPSVHLATLVQGLFLKNENGKAIEPRYRLKTLMSLCWMFQASVPQDIFYSLLPVCNDIHAVTSSGFYTGPTYDEKITPLQRSYDLGPLESDYYRSDHLFLVDYSRTFLRVCIDFVSFNFSQYGEFDVLCRPWAAIDRSQYSSLPSWLTTAFTVPFEWHGPNSVWVRRTADPLVGGINGRRSAYNASQGSELLPGWNLGDSGHSERSLFVQGFVLDTIREVSSPSALGNIPDSWFAFAQPQLKDFDNLSESISADNDTLWRTLVVDRDSEGRNPPVWYARAFNAIKSTRSKVVVQFLQRVQASIWGRRLFWTAKDHCLGLGPKDTHNGDVIAIVPGCSVPVLLRKHNGIENVFEFLGPCYVHHRMDGEAMILKEEKEAEYPIQRFELGQANSTQGLQTATNSRTSTSSLRNPPDAQDPNPASNTETTVLDEDPPPYSETDPLFAIMEGLFAKLAPTRKVAQSWKQYALLWTCSCGWRGLGEHVELVPGAMKELVDDFKRAFVVAVPIELPSNYVDRSLMLAGIRLQNRIHNSLWKLRQYFRQHSNSGQRSEEDAVENAANTPAGISGSSSGTSASNQNLGPNGKGETKGQRRRIRLRKRRLVFLTELDDPTADYMLLCIRDGKRSTARVDMKVNTIQSDQQLFKEMKDTYDAVKTRSWLSVVQLSHIKFVEFILCPNNEADRIDPDKIPPEEIAFYDFNPRKVPNPPPIGSNYLMHRFESPGACHDGTYCLTRIPKRKQGKPKDGAPDNGIAWGLHFEETLSYARVAGFAILSLIVSTGGGALWYLWQKDVKSSVTVSAYLLAFEASLLTLLQAALK